MENFKHYLLGERFLIRTDHAALKWLISFKNPEGQMARWLEALFIFDFEITHRPGRQHSNADALSRRPCNCRKCEKIDNHNKDIQVRVCRTGCFPNDDFNWKKLQSEDTMLALIIKCKEENRRPDHQEISQFGSEMKSYLLYWDSLELIDNKLFRRWESTDHSIIKFQLVIPRNQISRILFESHDNPTGGHFGVNKTLAKIRERFYWVTCKMDVENWCKKCTICSARNGPGRRRKAELQIHNVGSPFERIAVDILGPLPKSVSGNRYVLVVTDYFTRWPEAIPLPDQQTPTIVEALVTHVFSRFGIPLEMHSDQGRNFESNIFKEVIKLLEIKKTITTPIHPQSNGLVERLNRTILI